MSNEVGILSFGAYIPQRRLQRSAIYAANAWFAPELKGLAKGERAVANWDEDVITMAVEAGRGALSDRDRGSVGSLTLASTTLPFADRLNSGVVKEALNLNDAVRALDAGGSLRAGASALVRALLAATPSTAPDLCIAADMRKARPASEAEHSYGDGAAALLVGSGKPIARFLGSYSTTIDFVDHFRAEGVDFDYFWESRWVRDEGYMKIAVTGLKAALKAFGTEGADIDHTVIAISARRVPETIAMKAGLKPESLIDTLSSSVGDTGTVHPLLMLASALERARPGEKILVVAFGQGVDVLLFETTPTLSEQPTGKSVSRWISRGRSDDNYLSYLFHRGMLQLDRGMRSEHDQKQPGTTLYRNRKAVLGLIGGRCTKTGTVQFPKSDISVNPNDHALGTQEDYPLAERRARVVTHTADRLTYSPDPPSRYGLIDFEGGGRMSVEFTDVGESDIEVGREVRMVFRIKSIDEMRHFTRYFWKATPVD